MKSKRLFSTKSPCAPPPPLSSSFWLLLFLSLLCFLLFIFVFVTQWKEYFDQLDPMLSKLQSTLLPLDPRVRHLRFYEGKKSYTLNKRKIYICLKDEHKEYYDFNMLLYVTIHELAHVLCDEIGHTAKFDFIFHQLLQKAAHLGIYDPHKPILTDYCNHSS